MLGPHIRAVNYHSVPEEHASAFEDQVRYYLERFVPVDYAGLWDLHAGRWPHDRPGVLLSFDDGLASHARVVAPILERQGIVGWFFVPAGLVGDGVPVRDAQFPEASMTWADVRRLAERHVVGSHTMSHCRLRSTLSDEELAREIPESKRVLEAGLGREVPVFCW